MNYRANYKDTTMTTRQTEILAAIVETYAQSAEPVGSGALTELFDCSSATIRAEMVALEQEQYIMQPHISAGRVPTDKGYRAYVNAITPEESAPRPANSPTSFSSSATSALKMRAP